MRLALIFSLVWILGGCDQTNREIRQRAHWGHLPSTKFDGQERSLADQCRNVVFTDIPYSARDYGERLHIEGQPTTGLARQKFLGDTCAKATISTSVYQSAEYSDQNYYSILVEAPVPDRRCDRANAPEACEQGMKASTVLFQRDLRSSEVGEYFRGKEIDQVVEYEASTREVTFHVGHRTYRYRLPDL